LLEIPYRPGDEDKLYDKFVDWSRKEIHTNPRLAKDPTAQRRASLARPTGPDQKRQVQHVRAEQTTNRVRDTARDSARDANQSRSRSGSDSGSKSSGKSSDKKSDKKKDKKSKKHHKKPSGK